MCTVPKDSVSSLDIHFPAHSFLEVKKTVKSALKNEDKKLGDKMCEMLGFHNVEVIVYFQFSL